MKSSNVPRPPAWLTAFAIPMSVNPSMGALAMKGLVVWGNHFCKSFGGSAAAILLIVVIFDFDFKVDDINTWSKFQVEQRRCSVADAGGGGVLQSSESRPSFILHRSFIICSSLMERQKSFSLDELHSALISISNRSKI